MFHGSKVIDKQASKYFESPAASRQSNFYETFLQLCLFLNACDCDADKALQMLVKHYEVRKKAPQLFTRRDATLEAIKQSLENQYYINLPTTPDGYLVCFHGLRNAVAKNYFYDTSTTCFLMMISKFSV